MSKIVYISFFGMIFFNDDNIQIILKLKQKISLNLNKIVLIYCIVLWPLIFFKH